MDLKQNFSKQITKINMKTSSFLEENKIRTYISTLEREIADLKKQAGEIGYNMWSEGEWDQERMNAVYREAENRYQLIREQEEKIQELEEKNRQVLDGTMQQVETGDAGADSVFCPNCGAKYVTAVKFCRKCGYKIAQE